jgi:energy-coupling factor transporter ATP-binding protein EcfA2
MTSQWGRKESVVWPPHSPIYSYGALFLAFILTSCFIYVRFNYGQTPLQQFYTPIYAKTALGAAIDKKDKYQLLYVGDGSKAGQLAVESDVQAGTTPAPGGKHIGLAISSSALARGLRALYRGPEQQYLDKGLHEYLKSTVFQDDRLRDIYEMPLLFGLLSLFGQLPFSIAKDIKRRKQMKYGRVLKGPAMLTPKEFNDAVQGDGIGFKTDEAKAMMRIPQASEAQHFEIIGDTGSGKTTLILQMLRQIQARQESAIIYDPACEYVRRFYDATRGDIILNPLDDRCPYWGPSEELRRKAEAKAIAASLYQPTSDKKGEFFTETPQKIFAHLLTFGPTPQELVQWMSDPAEIDKRVADTELASILSKGAQQQRGGVLASLGLIADSLRMLPTKAQAETTWSATEWSEKRKGMDLHYLESGGARSTPPAA